MAANTSLLAGSSSWSSGPPFDRRVLIKAFRLALLTSLSSIHLWFFWNFSASAANFWKKRERKDGIKDCFIFCFFFKRLAPRLLCRQNHDNISFGSNFVQAWQLLFFFLHEMITMQASRGKKNLHIQVILVPKITAETSRKCCAGPGAVCPAPRFFSPSAGVSSRTVALNLDTHLFRLLPDLVLMTRLIGL